MDRPWYREPETFIAVTALIVSVSAVVVGMYEASLQRAHDRAEVWPHLELSTYTMPQRAELRLENTGIGPAIVESITVTVDGRPRRDWGAVLQALLGKQTKPLENSSVSQHSLRAGDRVVLVGVAAADLPPGMWTYIKRIGVRVCYRSVFYEYWTLESRQLGTSSIWTPVRTCEAQPPTTDF